MNERLTLDFNFVGPEEMTHKVPNISIYGNMYAQIPNSRNRSTEAVFYTEIFKEAVRVRLDPQEQLVVVPRVSDGNGLSYMRMYPTRHKVGFNMSRLWVSSLSWSQEYDERRIAALMEQVRTDCFFPSSYL